MGVDFISNKANAHRKGWDREAAAIASANIFREPTTGESRLVQGDLKSGVTVAVDDMLIIRLTEAGVLACRGEVIVAEFTSLPSEVLSDLRQAGNIATAKVEQVGAFGSTIKVSLK